MDERANERADHAEARVLTRCVSTGWTNGRTSVVIDRLDTDFLMGIIRAFDAGTTLETRSDPTVPFRPVTIASGDEAKIGIVGRTTDCAEATTNWEDGDSMSWSSIRVRYRLLFTAHERSVALATPIGILAPASDDCLGVGRPVSRLAPP